MSILIRCTAFYLQYIQELLLMQALIHVCTLAQRMQPHALLPDTLATCQIVEVAHMLPHCTPTACVHHVVKSHSQFVLCRRIDQVSPLMDYCLSNSEEHMSHKSEKTPLGLHTHTHTHSGPSEFKLRAAC